MTPYSFKNLKYLSISRIMAIIEWLVKNMPWDTCNNLKHVDCHRMEMMSLQSTICVGVSKPGGSLDRRVNYRRVPQPRWVDARRNAKGGKEAAGGRQAWESGSRDLRVSPAPESGALAVGGYKRPRGSGSERPCASAVPSFSARANPL
jgi:hypothetical protein